MYHVKDRSIGNRRIMRPACIRLFDRSFFCRKKTYYIERNLALIFSMGFLVVFELIRLGYKGIRKTAVFLITQYKEWLDFYLNNSFFWGRYSKKSWQMFFIGCAAKNKPKKNIPTLTCFYRVFIMFIVGLKPWNRHKYRLLLPPICFLLFFATQP